MDIERDIVGMGGLAPTWALLRRGYRGPTLTRLVARGTIIRVRQGWYALPSTPSTRVRAWRIGGRLTCSAGAREHGLPTISRSPGLHVAVRPHQSRLRTPDDHHRRLEPRDDIVIHWTDDGRGPRFIAPVLRCLLDMTECEPSAFVVAAADAAIRDGRLTRRGWLRAVDALDTAERIALADVDPASGSLLESVARVGLHRAGIPTRSQVQVSRGIRVDFVVGDRVIVELDGAGHAELDQLRADRERDLACRALGYRTLRYSGPQVLERWPAVLDDIRAAIRAESPGRRVGTAR